MPAFSPNPDKAQSEKRLLIYSPIWMAIVFATMASGAISHFTDLGFLILGVGLALPPWLLPLWPATPAESTLPITTRHAFRFNCLIAITVFVQSWAGTQLFFHRLGMEYHFAAKLELAGTPLFLYFLTVAYFSTYYVALQCGWRLLAPTFARAPTVVRQLVRAALCYAVAFGETFFMATDSLRPYFRYRDPHFMLLIGSACYGSLFFITLPVFERLDETARDRKVPLLKMIIACMAVNAVALVVYYLFAQVIEPR